MTARGVVLPLAIAAALGLAACAKQSTPTAAQPPPPAGSAPTTDPAVRTASADDPDAQAREEGFASAAEQARARANGEEAAGERPTAEPQPEKR